LAKRLDRRHDRREEIADFIDDRDLLLAEIILGVFEDVSAIHVVEIAAADTRLAAGDYREEGTG